MNSTFIEKKLLKIRLKCKPPLDDNFKPAVLQHRAFIEIAEDSLESAPMSIGIEKGKGYRLVYKTRVFSDKSVFSSFNYQFIEQLVKTLLWIYGGYKIIISGSKKIERYIKDIYSLKGKRSFDAKFMSGIYEKPFTVVNMDINEVTPVEEESIKLGGLTWVQVIEK